LFPEGYFVPEATSAPLNRPAPIHALTSLRFFAAFYVVLFHAFPSRDSLPPLGISFLNLGFTSVSFFFFLSGYILAIVYLPRQGKFQMRRFYVARFARIYPLFLLTILADTPILLHKRVIAYGLKSAVLKTIGTLAGNLLLMQAWFTKLQFALNGPSWSLSVETAFYLAFPFLGRALWKLNGRALWITAIVFYVGGQCITRFFTVFLTVDQVKFNPLFHFSTFALGILLARWRRPGVLAEPTSTPHSGLLYGSLAAAAIASFLTVRFSSSLPYTNVHDGLLAPIFAALIWPLSYPKFNVSRWLSLRWLVILGEASFGLYLLHVVLLHWYRRSDESMSNETFVLFLLICVALSVLLFYLYEAPARRWLLRRYEVKTPETLETASDA